MGTTAKQTGQADLTSKQQQQFINSLLGSNLGGAQGVIGEGLQPYDPEQFQSLFQKAFIDPAMMNYEQQILPSIYESFGDQGASSSLNQALASSAKDLATQLGTQQGQFFQQQQGNQLNLLQLLSALSGQRQFEPIVQQGYNPLSDIISGGAAIGAAYLGG